MTLEDIIAAKISASVLERVVTDQNVIGKQRRDDQFKSGLSSVELARKVVEAYASQTSRLAYGLYEQVSDTDWDTARLLFEHFKSNHGEYHNHQASLVGRIPNLNLLALNEFLTSIKNQVCLIVSRRGAQRPVIGTGFLVGPDLVLTCHHVLSQFPQDTNLKDDGNRIEIYFDFHRGEHVESIGPDLPEARKVWLADNWYVTSYPSTVPDGVPGDLSPDEAARIGSALDFILVRLEEKVGLQPLDLGGGRMRRWVEIPSVPADVSAEDWIIIPQHPNGSPQRIDLGRFRESDPTKTRLRYDTNTAHGSSGAPCFNHLFRLVGVHNAFVGPEEKPLANQAIRAACIAPLLQQYLVPAAGNQVYVLRWSLARDREPPQVVLGREKLLTWLQASATPKPKTFADRVYVAHTNAPAAGCSFSLDMLLAEIRDTKTPRAVYGQRGQQLPATVEDFLHSLLRELGITLAEHELVPSRPQPLSEGLAVTSIAEIDKFPRWISEELPNWLGGILDRHVEKEIDIRDSIRAAVAYLKAQNLPVPPEMETNAQSQHPVLVRPNVWDFAYIVIDDLRSSDYSGSGPRTELKGEVRDLIAALARGKSEAALHTGLRRLRWMFLGYLPDFVPTGGSDGGATVETLDPGQVGMKEVLAIFDRMSQAEVRMRRDAVTWRVLARAVMRSSEYVTSEPKLVALQRVTSLSVADFLAEMGG